MNDIHPQSHSTWNCKYHVVPKYRRKVFYGEKRYEIGQMLRKLCKWQGVNVLEAEACPDLWAFRNGKAVCRSMNNGVISDTNTGSENSGAKGIMWIRFEKIQRR